MARSGSRDGSRFPPTDRYHVRCPRIRTYPSSTTAMDGAHAPPPRDARQARFPDSFLAAGSVDILAWKEGEPVRRMIGVPLAIGALGAVLLLWRVVVPALSASPWTAAAPLPMALSYHSATLLQDGRVLVAGGYDSQRIYPAAFVFTPDGGGGRWQPVAPMHLPRSAHTATLLRDGRVLVAGGAPTRTSITPTAEIYDPRTGRWTM